MKNRLVSMKSFNPEKNYIGATEKQHKLTNWIFKLYKDINFTAYKHDHHYYLMFAERNLFVRLVMKIMYDLTFLILGLTRLFKNYRLDGWLIHLILYICLFVSTPVFLYTTRKREVNL